MPDQVKFLPNMDENEQMEILKRMQMMELWKGKIVKHFKGDPYLILGFTEHTETGEIIVVETAYNKIKAQNENGSSETIYIIEGTNININASSWIDKELDVVLYQLLATNFTYIYVHGSNSPNEQKIYKNDLIRMKNEF